MSELIKKWCVVALLILAVGGHWAILQSAAYLGMVVSYSKEATSLKEAFSKTLDGRHPCRLCRFVKEGKKAEGHSEPTRSESKIDFILQLSTAALYPPGIVLDFPLFTDNPHPHSSPPLLEPPRFLIS